MAQSIITKDIPIGAFIIFLLALFMFSYLLYREYIERNEENRKGDHKDFWIAIFMFIIIGCIVGSVICVFKTDNSITRSDFGKQIINPTQKFHKLEFKGKRIKKSRG